MQDEASTPAPMTAESAVTVLGLLDRAEVGTWVAGGWGVDALVGRASRPHGDLDLLVADDRGSRARRALAAAGFVCTLDELPTRFEMTHPRLGVVDLHPIVLDADGNARLELPNGTSWVYGRGALDALGTIGTRQCRCLSPAEQLRLHQGYELRDVDRADIDLLRSHPA
jgi:lincosamide nucleotidyltransferase A/C/D/E